MNTMSGLGRAVALATLAILAAACASVGAPEIGGGSELAGGSTPDAPRSFSIAAAGDILPHTAVIDSAAAYADARDVDGYDFRPMFADLAPRWRSTDRRVSPRGSAVGGQP